MSISTRAVGCCLQSSSVHHCRPLIRPFRPAFGTGARVQRGCQAASPSAALQSWANRSLRSCGAAATEEAASAHVACPGDFVVAEYTISLEDGTVVDSSKETGKPAEFVIGSTKVVPGFHQAVGGLAVGESRKVRVRPDDAYGMPSEELIVEIPKSQAPSGLEKGVTVQLTNGMQAVVVDVDEEGVTIDANHPLAGKSVDFEVALTQLVPASSLQYAGFGAGCFWSVELAFQRVPGVLQTSVGYSQGKTANPTYQDVCSGSTGHNEVVQVVYNPAEVSFEQLLDVFWAKHDPTTLNRQGGDVGTQYRSGIYWHTEEQRAIAEASKARENERLGGKVVTEIEKATTFYEAEEYHQQYLEKGGRFGRAQSAAKGCTDPIRCYG